MTSQSDAVVGIGVNEVALNVPHAFEEAAHVLGVGIRRIDLKSLRTRTWRGSGVFDAYGDVKVTHLAPSLFFWQAAAAIGFRALEGLGVRTLNTVSSVELADDKARTSLALSASQLAQVETIVVGPDSQSVSEACRTIGFPCVIKRSHGAQGRWVRLVEQDHDVAGVLSELLHDGPTALVVQRFVEEFRSRSIRVIVTAGSVLAVSLRTGPPGSFISNIAGGGRQELLALTKPEQELCVATARCLGLGHAGVDLVRTESGPAVLEVNACPDFTSMQPLYDFSLAGRVLEATLASKVDEA